MSKTIKLTEAAYHRQPGRPDVFIAGAGEEISYEVAVAIGLITPEKPASKVRKSETVENKAVKATQVESKTSAKE